MPNFLLALQISLLSIIGLITYFNFQEQPHYPQSMSILICLSLFVFILRNQFILSTLSLIIYLALIHFLILWDFKLSKPFQIIWLLNGSILIGISIYRYYLLNPNLHKANDPLKDEERSEI